MQEAEAALERMRIVLKQRGAEGVRGLARNFKICDRDGSRKLDIPEFAKCCSMCQLGLSHDEVLALHAYFDRDHEGFVSFDEFLQVVRGKLSPVRRKLVTKIFHELDARGDASGYLTVEDIQGIYDTTSHPDVKAGKMTPTEALRQFLEGFEGPRGSVHDGHLTLDEWIAYYEELSSSIDSDDYFGNMLVSTWSMLRTKQADGSFAPAITYVSATEVDNVEKIVLKKIHEKKKGVGHMRAFADSFKDFDLNKNGVVCFSEFVKAMERFGLSPAPPGSRFGGVPLDVLQGLFDRYDSDGSGALSYQQFAAGLFAEEQQHAISGDGANPNLPSFSAMPMGSSLGGSGITPSCPSTATSSLGSSAIPRPASAARVRSLANPMRSSAPDAFKRSSGIFG